MVSALQTVKFNSVPIDPTTDHNGQYERQRARSEKQSGKEPRQQQFEFEGGRSPMTAKASTLVGRATNHHRTKAALDERVEGQRRQKATLERIQVLLTHLSRYGIPEAYLFDVEDLMEHKNIPKVTRCFAMLAKMVS